MTDARVRRGRKTQEILADWFVNAGWKGAQSRPASLSGTDLYGMPGWAIEVKATRGLAIHEALKQASANVTSGRDFPLVVYRPPGFGPERIADWPVLMRLDDFTLLMQKIEGFDE